MKANPLVVALALLAALGGAVYYTSENPPVVDEDVRPTLVDVEQKDISQIVIGRPDGETVTFVRGEDEKWDFGNGITFPADDAAVGLMATNLAGMSAERTVEEQVADWRPFGLEDQGNLAVTMTPKEGDAVTVLFGNETPTGSAVFARLTDDPRLFTVYNYVKTSFDKTIFDWRSKRLLQVVPDDLSSLKLSVGSKRYLFAPDGPGAWKIVEPTPVRADDFTVGELVRAIQNAEMTEVVDESRAASLDRSFSQPFAVAEISDGSDHALTLIRSGQDYYAKTSDMGGTFAVSAVFAESLDKDLEDLRDKKLFDFGFDPITDIEIRDAEQSATIRKADQDWVLSSDGDRVLDSEKVQTLIDSLRNLAAVEFVSDRAGDQAARGLAHPVLEASVKSGEDTVERVILTEPAADRVFAARAGEPTTYRLERAQAEEVRRALTFVLDPSSSASQTDGPPAVE